MSDGVRGPEGSGIFLASAPLSSVPEGDDWLTPAEAAIVGRFRFSKRAADWRLGRWVAKAAVVRALEGGAGDRSPEAERTAFVAPSEIEILAEPGGAPRARVVAPGAGVGAGGGPPPIALSLSHSAGVGFATAAVGNEVRIGCDVEEVAPRSEAFVSDYFTTEEAAWIRGAGEVRPAPAERDVRANLLWSAKESALKALGEGLRMDTRGVLVVVEGSPRSSDGAWRTLSATASTGARFAGWWRVAGGFVWTVVVR